MTETPITDLTQIDDFDDIKDIIDVLPEAIQKVVRKVQEGHRIFKIFMSFIPKKYRGKIANLEGHQIVSAFKKAEEATGGNWDNEAVRTAIKNILIGLYDLDDEWLPKWPLNPDGESA